MQVRLFKPSVGEEELANIRDVFDRAWLGLGPLVGRFEEAWREYIGSGSAMALNSATAALHMALYAYRFPPGAKVLVPAITFASTATAVLYNGLEPVFVDIDPDTLSLSLDDAERKVTTDCVAVMAVHMGGHPAPMERVNAFAERHNLIVVEDCAHTAGGTYRGRKLGTWGHMGCFSFEEKKCMTTGDGGMLVTDDVERLEALRPARWVGIDKDTWKRAGRYTGKDADARHWYYQISVLGYKYNMNDLSAAIGLAQLHKLDAMNTRRRAIIARYLAGISGLSSVRPLLPYDVENGVYWIFGVRCDRRDDLILFLKERGIATGVHYEPLPRHPLFAPYANATPVADRVWQTFVTLPMFSDMTDEEVDYVMAALHAFEEDHG